MLIAYCSLVTYVCHLQVDPHLNSNHLSFFLNVKFPNGAFCAETVFNFNTKADSGFAQIKWNEHISRAPGNLQFCFVD